MAFFALLFDQDPTRPIQVFARDEAGNEVVVPARPPGVPEAVPARAASRSTTVPAARRAGHRQQLADEQIPTDDVLAGFLKINGDLRRKNNQYLDGPGEEERRPS